jgi:site-specific DNA-methyltransferase (adenine-specific)
VEDWHAATAQALHHIDADWSRYQVIDFRLGRSPQVFSDIPPGTMDAIFTDPPYGTESEDTGYGRRQLSGNRKGRTIDNDRSLDEFAAVLPGVVKLAKPGAWCGFFCSPKRRHDVDSLLVANGLHLFGEVVWDKVVPGLGYQIQYQHETIVVCHLGPEPVKPDFNLPSIIKAYLPRQSSRERHPHSKPVSLCMDVLAWLCPEGGAVLDPFAGEAPIAVAAAHIGRGYYGAELSPNWFENGQRAIQKARFIGGEDASGQGALL